MPEARFRLAAMAFRFAWKAVAAPALLPLNSSDGTGGPGDTTEKRVTAPFPAMRALSFLPGTSSDRPNGQPLQKVSAEKRIADEDRQYGDDHHRHAKALRRQAAHHSPGDIFV